MVAYGTAAHLAASLTLPALVPVPLFMLLLMTALIHRRWLIAIAALPLAATLAWVAQTQHTLDMLYLPPILINAAVLWGFASSLMEARTPLITLVAGVIEGELDEATLRYTRRATLWWTLFLTALLAENVALALWAPREIWSLFAHFINYLLIGLFFLAEFWLRKRLLPQRTGSGFVGFVKSLVRIDLHAVVRRKR